MNDLSKQIHEARRLFRVQVLDEIRHMPLGYRPQDVADHLEALWKLEW